MAAGDRLPDQVGSWQVSFLEAGDQSAADFALRQHRVEYGVQASFQRCMETDDRQRMGADVTCGLVERDDTPLAYRRRRSPYHRNGIRLVVQDIAADRSIEYTAGRKCLIRGDHEFNLPMSGRDRLGPPHCDRAAFAIEPNTPAGSPDGLGK